MVSFAAMPAAQRAQLEFAQHQIKLMTGMYSARLGKPQTIHGPNCINCGAAHEPERHFCSYCTTPHGHQAMRPDLVIVLP